MSDKKWLRGKLPPSKGTVFVQLEFPKNKAQMQRFGSAIIDLNLKITNTHVVTSRWVTVMVKVAVENIDELIECMPGAEVTYRSPTFFRYSAITPIYASPEDEINDICTPAYARFLEDNGEEVGNE